AGLRMPSSVTTKNHERPCSSSHTIGTPRATISAMATGTLQSRCRRLPGVRRSKRARRQSDPRSRADEARHHGNRLCRRSGWLQNRADSAEVGLDSPLRSPVGEPHKIRYLELLRPCSGIQTELIKSPRRDGPLKRVAQRLTSVGECRCHDETEKVLVACPVRQWLVWNHAHERGLHLGAWLERIRRHFQ